MDRHGYNPNDRPTHVVPPGLVAALLAAKNWTDNEPPAATGTAAGLAREDWEREAISLLTDIVEIVEETWGYAGAVS